MAIQFRLTLSNMGSHFIIFQGQPELPRGHYFLSNYKWSAEITKAARCKFALWIFYLSFKQGSCWSVGAACVL